MNRQVVHIDHPHTKGCNNYLVVLDEGFLQRHYGLPSMQQRDSIGRRHRHAWHWWLTLICNDTSCKAVVLLRTDAIEQLAMVNGGARETADA